MPAITMRRMQRAHLELLGEEQDWGKSRLDKLAELMDNGG